MREALSCQIDDVLALARVIGRREGEQEVGSAPVELTLERLRGLAECIGGTLLARDCRGPSHPSSLSWLGLDRTATEVRLTKGLSLGGVATSMRALR